VNSNLLVLSLVVFCCFLFVRRALEAKSALYDRLSRGEGLKELEEEEETGMGEGQHKYMVDFTRKIVDVKGVGLIWDGRGIKGTFFSRYRNTVNLVMLNVL